jgi:hypothetical protein
VRPYRHLSRHQHVAMWSFTIPSACMAEYTVVGPTKRNPLRRRCSASFFDSGVDGGMSATVAGAGAGAAGAADQKASTSDRPFSCHSTSVRALDTTASILPLWRIIDWSATSRSMSGGPNLLMATGSKFLKARRNASRLRSTTSHDNPLWNPSRHSFSNTRSSSRTGLPHSLSW